MKWLWDSIFFKPRVRWSDILALNKKRMLYPQIVDMILRCLSAYGRNHWCLLRQMCSLGLEDTNTQDNCFHFNPLVQTRAFDVRSRGLFVEAWWRNVSVNIMSYHLFGANPFFEPPLTYWFESNTTYFNWRKFKITSAKWKYTSPNVLRPIHITHLGSQLHYNNFVSKWSHI